MNKAVLLLWLCCVVFYSIEECCALGLAELLVGPLGCKLMSCPVTAVLEVGGFCGMDVRLHSSLVPAASQIDEASI